MKSSYKNAKTYNKYAKFSTTNQLQIVNEQDMRNKIVNNPGNTMKRKQIVVATSISPKRLEIQRKAIDSWQKAGFQIVSLNTQEEVDTIKQVFPDIKFHVVERSAIERYGKPYIYIYDMMRFLKNYGGDVCGIINSDIHLRGVNENFIDQVFNEARNGLVYGHRVDVHSLNDLSGTVCNGVDFFFFNKNIIDIYQDDGLCMGQPAWDWWMVCVAAAAKIRTKRVLSQIAFHELHPQTWYESLNQYLIESIVFDKYLKKLYPQASYQELNAKMWDIVISKTGIYFENSNEKRDNPAAIQDLNPQTINTHIKPASTSSNRKKIILATSIAPKRIDIQRSAIDTWLLAGFKVVSLNTQEEADTLKPYFPDIEFHIVNRSGRERFGTPYIYIFDFMRYLKLTNYRVCGIINSDIHFRNIDEGFINRIFVKAQGSLIYGHRVDVHHINEPNGTVSNGIDYFFFDKKLINIYKDEGFCMGQPAWDWWMVCVAASAKKRIRRVLNHIAYHQIHPQEWDQALNQYLIDSIVINKYVRKLYPKATHSVLNAKMWDIVISERGIVI
ncbi:hypothetical protein R4Z09_15805 [Niallia oryzisoli]|uniref:Uncharacterized protein n=1 Tax=Niallia oryzisoli TaxID=1737571 RepID=A0ABZ2CAB0_9BACI